MRIHYKTRHELIIDRVHNSKPGKESTVLKIFGMQGVPRPEVDRWIFEGSERYWTNFLRLKDERQREQQREKELEMRRQLEEKERTRGRDQEQ
jgi:hypothetical protein